jgi:uncharacterized protein
LAAPDTQLYASDVANHLACRHLTALDLRAAHGEIKPRYRSDPTFEALIERGEKHERDYLEFLRSGGLRVIELDRASASTDDTTEAMRSGADVIAQAPLATGRWFGRADVLRRTEISSDFGAWSYQVVDTKLVRETRAGTILQLCLYTEIVQSIQGLLPDVMQVVTPGSESRPETFRVLDYLAYYRLVKKRLESAVDGWKPNGGTSYPEPTDHCDICSWWTICNQRRRDDDHLSFVAGLTRLNNRELTDHGIKRLEDLANQPIPLKFSPKRGAVQSYVRLREQARLQLRRRVANRLEYELLELVPGLGLFRLPEPSPGDVFFDLEGDPFVGDHGQEYLFAYVELDGAGQPAYVHHWALAPTEERAAFEWFVDRMITRNKAYPGFHIYHFAPYESAALKRLMGRYATREDELDGLLRANRFVDLYGVVRQSLRAGVEKYSIKDLEELYGYKRAIPLEEASQALRALELALESRRSDDVEDVLRTKVLRYNQDDCESAYGLRQWLEERRTDLERSGRPVSRPTPSVEEPPPTLSERLKKVEATKAALVKDVPTLPEDRTPDEHGRWLLSELVGWHRREDKAPWWEFFRLRDLSAEELLQEKAGLAHLSFLSLVGGTERSPIHRYKYVRQDTDIREGHTLIIAGGEHTGLELGDVEAVDRIALTVDVKKRGKVRDVNPNAVFAHTLIDSATLADSILRLGQWVASNGLDDPGPFRAGRDLILRRKPRLHPNAVLREDGETPADAAIRLALQLEQGVLPIQGPPGAGKTTTGARMICELVRAGKQVGITAVSHSVIRNLLDKTLEVARNKGIEVKCVQKVTEVFGQKNPSISEEADNKKALATLRDGDASVGAGTAWFWAREDAFESVDVLFVDEAGQMSLANVLAVAQAAKNIVLLGDPQQLDQPQQGSHPDGTDVSALQHVLGDARTLPNDSGLFLDETWRLNPEICAFTSEAFYDSRLRSRPGLERRVVEGETGFTGAGLWFAPVTHDGNQSSSPEEADRVADIFSELTSGKVSWVNSDGTRRVVGCEDVLIVVPYNAQITEIGERIPQARVGTVDRFQGREAPIVIYSMATSTPEDAPRGMEFLYSINRLNVATSRAKCACILVASPRLFEPECRTPRQIQLANAFCRYLELATLVK